MHNTLDCDISWDLSEVIRLFKDATNLSDKERATLAGLLIESLESEIDPDIDEAWSQEIDRRIAELDSGRIETVPWEVVRANLLETLRRP